MVDCAHAVVGGHARHRHFAPGGESLGGCPCAVAPHGTSPGRTPRMSVRQHASVRTTTGDRNCSQLRRPTHVGGWVWLGSVEGARHTGVRRLRGGVGLPRRRHSGVPAGGVTQLVAALAVAHPCVCACGVLAAHGTATHMVLVASSRRTMPRSCLGARTHTRAHTPHTNLAPALVRTVLRAPLSCAHRPPRRSHSHTPPPQPPPPRPPPPPHVRALSRTRA